MDALEFLKEFNRMCESYSNCTGCPRKEKTCDCLDIHSDSEMKILIATIEQWSKENPHKTRQSVFLEQYSNCMMDDNGVVEICPRNVDKMYVCDLKCLGGCTDCRKDFWMQEVE